MLERGPDWEWPVATRLVVVAAPESKALRRYLARRQPLVSSALARTEVARALLPAGTAAVARGQETLRRIQLLRVNDRAAQALGWSVVSPR